MSLAHLPVFGAIAFTMYANASYAYAHAGDVHSQVAMVVLALTVDIAKATFLSAAANHRARGRRIGPTLLVLLWFPALAYSTFAGYAYLMSNRMTASATGEAIAQGRSRLQADYDRASADLIAAKRSADWQESAACARPRRQTQVTFCARIAATETNLKASGAALDRAPVVHVNPEITALAEISGWPGATLAIIIALFPAVLIELVAGLGLYALRKHDGAAASVEPMRDAVDARPLSPRPPQPPTGKTAAKVRAEPVATTPNSPPQLRWKRHGQQ